MSATHSQRDKISTTARVAISSGPAAAAIEPRKNKYKKIHKYRATATETNPLHQPSKTPPVTRATNTKGVMPKVHVAHPTATLNYIDIDQVGEWENYESGKLLAIPFGNEAENIDNHNHIGERLLTAVTEITQVDNVGISTPIPSEKATRNGNTPTTFLIYNLSHEEINTLMQRGVWSSPAITFRFTELSLPCPDFLFTIKGFTTRDDTSILNLVKTVWQGNDTQNLIAESFTKDCRPDIRNKIHDFLHSVYIKRLNYRNKGNIEAPRFNVYADGQFILDDNLWFRLRESLANLPYTTPMLGRGTTEITPSTCGICHGVDHPAGMCEFPEMEGWNGPTCKTIAMTSYQFGDRNRRGTRNRNTRQMRF